MAVRDLKRLVIRHCDTLQALLAFNYHFGEDEKKFLANIRATLEAMNARELRRHRDELASEITRLAKLFGLKGRPEKFATWFKNSSHGPLGILELPKWGIDSQSFTNFTGDKAQWSSYSPHTWVALDFDGLEYKKGHLEISLPEIRLYEDMCLAFNNAVESEKDALIGPVEKIKAKTHGFFVRTAVLSAFYFVEAYLNGVAFDFAHRNPKQLTHADRDVLLEWNSQKNREQWVNFRAKLLQYPRIILRASHPPLTETNCPEMAVLLGDAKAFRDALVHASPKLDQLTDTPEKMGRMVQLRLHNAREVVDGAVGLVLKLNALLGSNGITLDWVYPRDATGRFPPKAFC